MDTFFDKVMVMVDDEHSARTGWHCCRPLVNEFSTIADFSEIVTEGKEATKSTGIRKEDKWQRKLP